MFQAKRSLVLAQDNVIPTTTSKPVVTIGFSSTIVVAAKVTATASPLLIVPNCDCPPSYNGVGTTSCHSGGCILSKL